MMTEDKDGQREFRGRRERTPDIWLPQDAIQQDGVVDPNAGLPYPDKPQLIVFGGSFDPVHTGHINLARKVLEAGLGSEVLFVPAKQSPLKAPGQSCTGAARMEMLKLAIAYALEEKREYVLTDVNGADFSREYLFSTSDIELTRPGTKSYTIDTMDIIRRIYPGHDIKFMFGSDCLLELKRWHRYGELFTKYDFIIYPRPGSEHIGYMQLADIYGGALASRLLRGMLVHPGGGELPRMRPRKMRPNQPLPPMEQVDAAIPAPANADGTFMDAATPAESTTPIPPAEPVAPMEPVAPAVPERPRPLVRRFTAADFPMLDVSSTALRQAVAAGNVPDGLIAPPVLDYIAKHKLYQN